MNLYFVSTWAKDKKKTWSGTNWGIYSALSKFYQIQDISLPNKKSLFARILDRLIKKSIGDMGLGRMPAGKRLCREIINQNQEDKIVFQFAEYAENTPPHTQTYVYQDLSVDYVWYMLYYLPDVFKVSAWQNNDPKAIGKRRLIQNDYYRNHCSGIFAMGKWFAEDLVNRTGIPRELVHHVGGGVNSRVLDPSQIDRRGNKILFVGRDWQRKGLPITMEAFCLLKQTMLDAEIYVAGPKQDPYADSPIEGYHYLGDMDNEALSHYLSICDIFCMPSYFEAYGLVFIEALTAGLPCIGRDCYEMPYFIQDGETGYLIQNDDAAELARKMALLLKDERIKRNVAQKHDWYVKEYSWDAVAERMASVMGK
jgi:glycosyltransferase involved in cell wall biosynthesis